METPGNASWYHPSSKISWRVVAPAILLALLSTSCGSPASSVDGVNLSGGPVYMQVTDKAYFTSVSQMYDASELVIVGEISAVTLDDVLSRGAPVGEDSFPQLAIYTVTVDEVLKGRASSTIDVVRTSFVSSENGLRPVSMQGILPNEIGDKILWFLEPSRRAGEWVQVSLDALLEIRGDRVVSELDSADRLGSRLNGQSAQPLLAALRSHNQ